MPSTRIFLITQRSNANEEETLLDRLHLPPRIHATFTYVICKFDERFTLPCVFANDSIVFIINRGSFSKGIRRLQLSEFRMEVLHLPRTKFTSSRNGITDFTYKIQCSQIGVEFAKFRRTLHNA